MSGWPGIRNDTADVGEGLLSATGVSYRIDEELRRRFCLGQRVALSGTLSSELQHSAGGSFLIVNDGTGNLKGIGMPTGSSFTTNTLITTLARGTFARCNNKLYYANDYDVMKVITRGDQVGYDAGIAAPASLMPAPSQTAGLVSVGVHLIRFRFMDSKTQYISDPSAAITVTVASIATLTFAIGGIGNPDPKSDTLIFEMTTAGGSAYYRAVTQAYGSTTLVINLSDASLIQLQPTQVYGDFGQQQPPRFSIVAEHRGRLFGWGSNVLTSSTTMVNGNSTQFFVTAGGPSGAGAPWAGRLVSVAGDAATYTASSVGTGGFTLTSPYPGTSGTKLVTIYNQTPDMLYWSRPAMPEAWKPLEWARRVFTGKSDFPAGMWSFYDDLYLFGQRSVLRFQFTNDPASGRLIASQSDMGVWNQQCIVEAAGNLYGWGRSGAWCIQGVDPDHISRPIDDTVNALLDTSQVAKIHANYDPRERVIQWFFVATGQTQPTYSMAYDVDRATWSLRQYLQTITASTQAVSGINPLRAILSDGNGYSWFLADNVFDGLPSAMTTGIITAQSGATTTVISANQTLDTATGLAGCMLYRPATGESKVVSANTSTQLTLGAALSSAPSNGETLYLGAVPWSIGTMWWTGKGQQYKDRPAYLNMHFMPQSATQLFTLQLFLDFSSTPYSFTTGATDTYPDGVVVTNSTSITVMGGGGTARDGFISIPMPSDWARVISATLTSYTPVGPIRLLAFYFSSQPHDANTKLVEGE
jgi:hypothetical protein